MDDNDSDSSSGEYGAFTETSVLLGFPTTDPADDATTHLGGLPAWIDGKTAPSGSLAKCSVCNNLMVLILQLHGDLPQKFPGHERWLYLFICPRKACRRKTGCVRLIRGVRHAQQKHEELKPMEKPQEKRPDIGATLFGVTSTSNRPANPFSSTSTSSSSNPFATSSSPINPFGSVSELAAKPPQKASSEVASLSETFAAKARISADNEGQSVSPATPRPHEPWPESSKFPPAYPIQYFESEFETLSETSNEQTNTQPNVEYTEDIGGGGNLDDSGLAESIMDKTFRKFADRVDQNPEQALRYEFGGIPLLYSTTDEVGRRLQISQKGEPTNGGSGMPRCENCGQQRVFEAQLMPYTITVLEENEMTIDGMDWGTVILGVCSKDCLPSGSKIGDVGYTEEWAGVQWEELNSRRR